jgi:LPS export ABC transporter protein LptC
MIKSRFFWIISATFVIAILMILNYNSSSITMSPSYRTSSMHNLHLKHREDNKVKWVLSSDKAILPMENKEIFLESLTLKINQDPEIYLTSGKGLYDVDQGNVTLNETVKLSIKDATFTTDSLNFDSKEELITTEDDIKLTGGSFLINGKGLYAQVKEDQVRIIKDVKAVFYR